MAERPFLRFEIPGPKLDLLLLAILQKPLVHFHARWISRQMNVLSNPLYRRRIMTNEETTQSETQEEITELRERVENLREASDASENCSLSFGNS